MILVFHGGRCCGIKTIHKMGTDPLGDVGSLEPLPDDDRDQSSGISASNISFFTDAAPQESRVARLDRLISFCERKRPQGVIEIVLADSKHNWLDQMKPWSPYLLERGFKVVNSCKNSNSGNIVHIFHKNTGE